MCRTAVISGPVSSEVKSSSSSSRSGMAHPMFSGSRLSTLPPPCHAVRVISRRVIVPLAWTVLIFWLGGNDWSAESTREYVLPLLHHLLPWASAGWLDLAHRLVRQAGHV